MKKYYLLFTLIISSPIYSMLVRSLINTAMPRAGANFVASRSLPYIQDTLDFIKDPKNVNADKHNALNIRLSCDPNLSCKEIDALQIAKRIIAPTQLEEHLLHNIIDANDNELLQIALLHGLSKYIEVKNHHYSSPLYVAAIKGYTNLMTTLIANKAHVNSQNWRGQTPLIGIASRLDRPNVFDNVESFIDGIILLKNAGANPYLHDDHKKTAIDYVNMALDHTENQRQRTIRNEEKEQIRLYELIKKLMTE